MQHRLTFAAQAAQRRERASLGGMSQSQPLAISVTARDNGTPNEDKVNSDVDLVLDFAPDAMPNGFQFIAHIERLRQRLAAALLRNVDIVVLPARRRELQETLHREAVPAF